MSSTPRSFGVGARPRPARTVRRLALPLLAGLLALPSPAASAPLAGTYTVGGESPHFPTLQEAVAALAAEGVSGPVVFDIRTGEQEGPLVVSDVTGASAENTVTFQSETGVADDVVVSSDTGLVWQVSGDWITLQHLTLRQDSVGSEYARVLEVTGDVNHVQVLDNRLVGTTSQTNIHDRYAVLFNWKTTDYAADDILIEGNEILNGSVGVYWGGSSLNTGSGLRIRNNRILDWGMRGIQLLTEPAAVVAGNEIAASSTYSAFPYAVLLEQCDGAVVVEKNRISTTEYVGLAVREGLATAEAPAVVANNFVQVGYPSSIGLHFYESEYQQSLHNTVVVDGNFASSVAMDVYYGAHNLLLGNIFSDEGSGSAIRITFPDTNVDDSDYNLLHAASGVVGLTSTFTQHVTLADWQAATGLDLHSLAAPPVFLAPDDLHLDPASPGIDLALPGVVVDDIDYATRPPAADIGADEQGYSACEFLAAVSDANCPVDDGAIDLTPVAGEPPFAFLWDDGVETEDRTDLAPGTYSVTVTGDAGCEWAGTFVVECAPGDPVLELVAESVVDATCAGVCDGAVEVVARGGEPPYSYFVRTRDTAWRASDGTEDELCADRYAFRVRDAAGSVAAVAVTVAEPPRLQGVPVSRENVSCKGEADASFEVGAAGGAPPYRFSKDGGFAWQDDGYFDALAAGTYPVRIQDVNECELGRDLPISEPPELLLTVVEVVDETFPGAADGSIEVASMGGTGDHEYSIDGGQSWQSSPIFGGLGAGAYTVLVQDESSCTRSVDAVVG